MPGSPSGLATGASANASATSEDAARGAVRRHVVDLDEDVLVAWVGAHAGQVEVDRAVAVDVHAVRLPGVRQRVAVGVGPRQA